MISPRLLALLAVFCAAVSLHAQSIPLPGLEEETKEKVTAALISEVTAAAPGKPFRVLVKLEHVPGAHTYGKTLRPEIVGKPTKLIWTLPDGWKMDELPWPPVHPFKGVDGSPSEGYEGTVHLPARLTPPASAAAGGSAPIIVTVDGLVCDDSTCTPFKSDAKVTVSLAETMIKDTAQAALFPNDLPAPPARSGDAAAPTFLLLMFYALLGGLILNVMPCVFPVLGIKVVGVVQQVGGDRRQVVLHGLVYTAGILLSFWVLGGVVVAFGKSWGSQFQSVGFTYALVILFLVFGLNMAGVFEIGTSAVGIGSNLQRKHGLSGSFFSGLLATVVSTPCSAPFLAAALSSTLTLPAPQAMLLFTLIGVGLASPFLLLSAFPHLISKLPRPGAWMESFKQGMSFLLFGTVAFMLWTLNGRVEGFALLWLLLSLAVVSLGCWIYGRWALPYKSARTRLIAVVLAVAAFGGGLLLGWPPQEERNHSGAAASEYGLLWEPWSETKVQELVAAGKPVYIDFTAKWCLTCQVNKRVYSDPAVQELFKKHGVVAVKADYTSEDPEIHKAFTALGRAAIPVNALYIPGRAEPLLLSELLTADNVSEVLQQIGQ